MGCAQQILLVYKVSPCRGYMFTLTYIIDLSYTCIDKTLEDKIVLFREIVIYDRAVVNEWKQM